MLLTIKRIFKFGWQNFWRNRALSLQAVLIFSIAVFSVSLFFFVYSAGNVLISLAEEKFDISVYFKSETTVEEITQVKDALLGLSSDVKVVDYISKDKALATFLAKHQNDSLYTEALNEIEENPFLASLNVKANQQGNYSAIAEFLSQEPYNNLVERVSYSQNKQVIDRMFSITNKIKFLGIILAAFFGALVFFITFNTIRLLIHSSRDEISTMKLVGASDWFIRGPLLVQGFLYSIFASVLVDITFLATIMAFKVQIANWFFNFDILAYFIGNFWLLIAGQFFLAGALGAISTLLAVHKYLKM